MGDIPILGIVGRSKSGKTTLLEKLIPALKEGGYKIATIKHHAHPGIEIDRPGKDTWRHAQAGSDYVIIAAPDKVASIRRVERAPTLEELAASIEGVDLILTEGYSRATQPKIEVVRAARSRELICSPADLVAIATDSPLPVDLPQFGLEAISDIVAFIEERLLNG